MVLADVLVQKKDSEDVRTISGNARDLVICESRSPLQSISWPVNIVLVMVLRD